MKKDIKKKKPIKKAIKPRKIEVVVDMTELPASEAIMKLKCLKKASRTLLLFQYSQIL